MSDPRKPSLILPVAVTLPVLLLAGYVGAYYAMVEPFPMRWHGRLVEVQLRFPLAHGNAEEMRSDAYRRAYERWTSFFAPIHWLDRRIRPQVWEPPELIIETESLIP